MREPYLFSKQKTGRIHLHVITPKVKEKTEHLLQKPSSHVM